MRETERRGKEKMEKKERESRAKRREKKKRGGDGGEKVGDRGGIQVEQTERAIHNYRLVGISEDYGGLIGFFTTV